MSELTTTYDFYKNEFELWRKILSRRKEKLRIRIHMIEKMLNDTDGKGCLDATALLKFEKALLEEEWELLRRLIDGVSW